MVALVDLNDFYLIWKLKDVKEICLVVFAFCVTIFLGAEIGILLNIALAVMLVIRHTTLPHVSVLGVVCSPPAVPGAKARERFKDIKSFPQAQPIPGIAIIRIEEALYFANISQIREIFRAIETIQGFDDEAKQSPNLSLPQERKERQWLGHGQVKAVVIDARNIPSIDVR